MTTADFIAIIISVCYIIFAIISGDLELFFNMILYVMFCLMLILGADFFQHARMRGMIYLSKKSPPNLIKAMGWFFLIGYPLINFLIFFITEQN